MPTEKHKTIWDRLTATEIAVENALANADIRAALALYGYDEARLQEGQTLYQEAHALAEQQRVDYGEQYEATQNLGTLWEEANSVYTRSLQIARIALRDHHAAHDSLMLEGERKKSFSGWQQQANTFYSNLLASRQYLNAMALYGYNREGLAAEYAQVQAVADANATQESRKGVAQNATQLRNASMDALDQWMSDFKIVASLALAENPQHLEKLGFGPV